MAEINLTQEEANILIAMEKHRANEDRSDFPMRGQSLTLPLLSADGREQFLLDLSRARIDLQKVKMQNRGRQVLVLVRLDLGGAPHRNPDDEEIGVYRICTSLARALATNGPCRFPPTGSETRRMCGLRSKTFSGSAISPSRPMLSEGYSHDPGD
jgi:hypothetical protein